MIKKRNVLGVMSSTSYEEIYLSLISTDGVDIFEFVASSKLPYDDLLKEKIKSIVGFSPLLESNQSLIDEVNEEITQFYISSIRKFIEFYDLDVDLIGLEGQTIYYDIKEKYIYQLGNPQKISNELKVDVVSNFHNADILAGGQGFPLTPSFYAALMNDVEKPAVVINLSGVSSIVWVGEYGEMMAFDAAPGNLAINEWTQKRANMHMDYNGKLAVTGKSDEKIVSVLLKHKFFAKYPPKSLPHSVFLEKMEHLEGLSAEDGAATLTSFIAEALAYSILMYLPEQPKSIALCGGGIKNPTLVRFVRQKLSYLGVEVRTSEEISLNASSLDASAVAFLAARRLGFLPASFPSTTGAREPIICGTVFEKN